MADKHRDANRNQNREDRNDQRNTGRDQRAEHNHQHQQRDGNANCLAGQQVGLGRFNEGVVDARKTTSDDGKTITSVRRIDQIQEWMHIGIHIVEKHRNNRGPAVI